MNEDRFESLLNGVEPTLEDFAGFVSVAEKLPVDLLWKIAPQSTSLHWMLKKVVLANLQKKIAKENVDNAMNAILTRLSKQ
jgi:hypothetical protein